MFAPALSYCYMQSRTRSFLFGHWQCRRQPKGSYRVTLQGGTVKIKGDLDNAIANKKVRDTLRAFASTAWRFDEFAQEVPKTGSNNIVLPGAAPAKYRGSYDIYMLPCTDWLWRHR